MSPECSPGEPFLFCYCSPFKPRLSFTYSVKPTVICVPFLFFVQSLSHVRLLGPPQTAACQASLSFTIFQSLLRLMSIESVMPSNRLILYHPLLLLPSIFPSIRVFSNELALRVRWPKYWSFSFSISPSSEYSGLISFRIGRFYLCPLPLPIVSSWWNLLGVYYFPNSCNLVGW